MAAPEPESGPDVRPCANCGGACLGPEERLTSADCRWFGNRLAVFYEDRPPGVPEPHEFPGYDPDEVEAEQLWAFEHGIERWWLVVPPLPGEDDGAVRWFEG